ncbi:hypothetical protein [Streptomyces sp. NBC_01477]|uniref:hypothetical protein n=1 Tax=Streptomyces sp. NBC_01477 TaxID=2976015 RepID=UPI002E349D1B|nr:hypothetical protein [Streptomyces sp. NBC_01477]
MPDTAPAWHLSLTDSVYALGAAARELRAAHQHAQLTARTTDPARIVPVPGHVTTAGAEPVRPHDEALWQLSDLYMVLEHHTAELYENAALGYAHGTAAAVQAVLRNDHPRHVDLPRDRNGMYVLDPADLPDLSQSLTTAAGARDLADLRARLLACAQEDDPAALANTAYAYGECAERALRHLIRHAETHGFLHAS